MKKIIKSGLILAALMAGNAQAAIVNFDLTGTVSYGYGVSNQGDIAHFKFTVDTSVVPSYNQSSQWYNYSKSENVFNSSVSSFSGNVGNNVFSGNNSNTVAYAYNEIWYGNTYNGAGVYTYAYNNSYYTVFGVYSSGSNVTNINDLVSSLLNGGNGLNFYFSNQALDNWSSYAQGTFDSIKVSNTPIPAAVWLLGSGLAGLLGFGKRKSVLTGTLVSA